MKEITDQQFEQLAHKAGWTGTLLELGWMRWAYNEGMIAAQTSETIEHIKSKIPPGQASPL